MGQKEHSRAPSYYLPIINRNRQVGRVCSSCHMVNSLKQCCVFRAAGRHLWLSMGPFMKLDTVSTIALSIGTGCLSEPAATAVQFLALQMLRMKPRRLCIGGKHFQQSYRLPPLTLIFQPSSDSHMLRIQAGTTKLSIPPQLLRGHLKTHFRTLQKTACLLQATTTCVSCRRKAASVHHSTRSAL